MPSSENEDPQNTQHVILMLHGIRDFASGWQETAKRILEAEGSAIAIGIRFGYYDALSFIAPVDWSNGPYQKLLSAYEKAREAYPEAKISILAHSFGTFLVGRLLHENAAVRIHRVLFCGAVIREDYPLDEVTDRFTPTVGVPRDRLLNECGTSDIWPVMAKAISNRYGDTGRHGLSDDVYSTSVFYHGGHSLFFTERHIRSRWKPFFLEGIKPKSNDAPPTALVYERFLSIPFARLFFKLLITTIWSFLYLWPLTLLLLAVLTYYLFVPGIAPKLVNLANYAHELRKNSVALTQEDLARYINGRLSESEATIDFDAVVVSIDASSTASNQTRTMFVAPPTCKGIKSDCMIFEVTFPEKTLPDKVDFTSLAPSGSKYRMAHVTARVNSILWNSKEYDDEKTDGRVFLEGLEFELSDKLIDCTQ